MHLGDLRPGDHVSVQRLGCTFTYKIIARPFKVCYTDAGVLRGVPGQQRITLVTLHACDARVHPMADDRRGRAVSP
jgi:sortase (surface protein transpeptidase)